MSHVTRIPVPLSRSKGQRSRSPGLFTHRGLNASGSCSGERGNVLGVGNYCYTLRCARRREALRRPQREERGGGISWRPPAYSLFWISLAYSFVLLIFARSLIFIGLHTCVKRLEMFDTMKF